MPGRIHATGGTGPPSLFRARAGPVLQWNVRFFLLTAGCLAAAGPPTLPQETAADAALLSAVADVESAGNPLAQGDRDTLGRPKALGAWQMHAAAWQDGNAWRARHGAPPIPRAAWHDPAGQRAVAFAFLSLCRERLQRAGIARPTVRQVYLAFTMGHGAFESVGFDPGRAPPAKACAAARVESLFWARLRAPAPDVSTLPAANSKPLKPTNN